MTPDDQWDVLRPAAQIWSSELLKLFACKRVPFMVLYLLQFKVLT